VTLELGVFSVIIGLLIALPIGIYSAIRQNTISDYAGRGIAVTFISVPTFWTSTMVMIFPALWWGWAPSVRLIPFTQDPLGNLGMFLLPATILGTVLSGTTMRMTRTMALEVLRQDYIRTAWSKGLREKIVVLRHVLKNALIPVVTIVGFQLPILIGGSVIIEQIFVLPGLGTLLLDSISKRDYPIISGINLFFATAVVLINLLIDLTYAFLDPRVRYR
jgi:peptide/nickel transport system permease protein